jgi:uncharacterized integral membrane protein
MADQVGSAANDVTIAHDRKDMTWYIIVKEILFLVQIWTTVEKKHVSFEFDV